MILLDFLFWFTASATLFLLGVIGLICWHRAQPMRRLAAEYRAFVLDEEAKRYMDRVRAREREVFYDPYD